MKHQISRRFWVLAAFAIATCILGLVTLIARDWIETLFGVDPDGGNGLTEWMIVAALFGSTLIAAGLARREWKLGHASI